MISLTECCLIVLVILCIICIGAYDPGFVVDEGFDGGYIGTEDKIEWDNGINYDSGNNGGPPLPPAPIATTKPISGPNNAKVNSRYFHDDINAFSEVDFDIDVPLVRRYSNQPPGPTVYPFKQQRFQIRPTEGPEVIAYPTTSAVVIK
jgi:hypothetical protein